MVTGLRGRMPVFRVAAIQAVGSETGSAVGARESIPRLDFSEFQAANRQACVDEAEVCSSAECWHRIL